MVISVCCAVMMFVIDNLFVLLFSMVLLDSYFSCIPFPLNRRFSFVHYGVGRFLNCYWLLFVIVVYIGIVTVVLIAILSSNALVIAICSQEFSLIEAGNTVVAPPKDEHVNLSVAFVFRLLLFPNY